MSGELLVRRALLNLPEDGRAYRQMLAMYAADPLGQHAPLDDQLLDKVIADLRDHPCMYPFLALLDGEPAGFATCFLGYSTFKAAPLMNIHDIAVAPVYRRRGIGRALIQAIAAEATNMGCCRLTLEVREDNPGAMALYRQMGFGVSTPGGAPVAHHFLERPLPPHVDPGN
jgi:ribosomal protein S18 acetylase RimI-like enzyme